MPGEIATHWPVLLTLDVGADELDGDRRLTDAGIERLLADARIVYLEKCATVDISSVDVVRTTVRSGPAAVGPSGVTVSVGVLEVFPDRFTMNARVRPIDDTGAEGAAATAWCEVTTGGEVTTAMRDEFVKRAQEARYLH